MAYEEDANEEPFKTMTNFSPLLTGIHDKLSGTYTVWENEILRNPLTSQPILRSDGRPVTVLKPHIQKIAGAEPCLAPTGVAEVLRTLETIVNRGSSFANLSTSDIVFETNDVVGSLNDNITLSSGKYGVRDLASWRSATRDIRNFLYNFLTACKDGRFMDWSENILGVQYGIQPMQRPVSQEKGSVLGRLLGNRQQAAQASDRTV